jgi:hypothetical protein
VLDEPRALLSQYVKSASNNCAAGATITLLDTTVAGTSPTGSSTLSGPGNIEELNLAIVANGLTDQGPYANAVIKVYVDGAGSPSLQFFLGDILASQYVGDGNTGTATTFLTDEIGLTARTTFEFAGRRRIFIPYTTSCKITYTNGSGTQAAQVFSQVEYRQGTIPTWRGGPGTRRAVLRQAYLPNPMATGGFNVSAYAAQDLLNISSVRGELEGVHFSVITASNSPAAPTYLEGHVQLYLDGTLGYEYGGTEDFFGGAFYFVTQGRSDSVGCAYQGTWNTTALTTCAYKLFGRKPGQKITFNSSVRLVWNNGIAALNNGYQVWIQTNVLYYTDH